MDKLFFVLDGVNLPQNIAHFLRLSESLGLSEIYINGPTPKVAQNVSRNAPISIKTVIDLPIFIDTSQETIDFIALEITNKSINYWEYSPPPNKKI